MKLLQRILRTALRRASTKFMDQVGSKLVSRMADTSSDAPSAFHEPKRNLYAQMYANEQSTEKEPSQPELER